jgi:sortase A
MYPGRMRGWRIIDFVGRALVGAGVLVLLFVAYQLWGTGIIEQRAQKSLKQDFEQTLKKVPPQPDSKPYVPAEPTDKSCGNSSTSVAEDGTLAAPAEGQPVAHIVIPAIGVDKIVVQGVGLPDLKKGPGHYKQTPFPGQKGNASIAGHRTTYGAPFNRLDELENGDAICVTTQQGLFFYQVTEKKVVKPRQTEVLNKTDDNRLTLTTCNPKYSASQRLVVISQLMTTPATVEPITITHQAVPEPKTTEPAKDGLSGGTEPRTPAVLWGLLAAGIALAIIYFARRWNRWVVYVLGAPIFLVVLFVFFENFSRLLPANV